MKLAGIDLAWHGEKNPSAIAVGNLEQNVLHLSELYPACIGIRDITNISSSACGIAIDAPLIINNASGQRECEKQIGSMYGSRGASCHTSNLNLYPDALSVNFANALINQGFTHLDTNKWIIECYPHPSLIEIFGLPERLKYKKGKKADKILGQVNLADLIKSLSDSEILKLIIPKQFEKHLDKTYINQLIGKSIKTNEDALDSIICLYIAGLYQLKKSGHLFGDKQNGYVWVPQGMCV